MIDQANSPLRNSSKMKTTTPGTPWCSDLEEATNAEQQSSGFFLKVHALMGQSTSLGANDCSKPSAGINSANSNVNDAESNLQHGNPSKVALENAINNVIVFVTDIQSGHVEDLIHGSSFGKVWWFFLHTKEQFCLWEPQSWGIPDYPLFTTHKVSYPVFTVPAFPGHQTTTIVFLIDLEQNTTQDLATALIHSLYVIYLA
ncbi:hypothetical protein BJ742DRAFT_855440 [Cladochytrium replicatum]|nr:hypothetical protein BJ742DRAFT_855440 [Cladochytrium replicatum]